MQAHNIFCVRLEVSKDAALGAGYCILCDKKIAGQIRFGQLFEDGQVPKTKFLMQHWKEKAASQHRCPAVPVLHYDNRFSVLQKGNDGKMHVKPGEFIDARDL